MKKIIAFLLSAALLLNAEIVRKKVANTYKFFDGDKEINITEVTGKISSYSAENKIDAELNFINGVLNGTQKEFYPDGKIKAEYQLKNGVRDGIGKEFNDEGKLVFERNLTNGNGIGTEFYSNGMKKRIRVYENGKQVKASKLNCDLEGNRFKRTAEELYIEGQSYAVDGLYHHAIDDFEQFMNRFPEHKLAPNVKFLIGFTYNNQLGDIEAAKQQYKEFLTQFPNHDLKSSAEYELKSIKNGPQKLPDFGEK